jgi:hypothetical protein
MRSLHWLVMALGVAAVVAACSDDKKKRRDSDEDEGSGGETAGPGPGPGSGGSGAGSSSTTASGGSPSTTSTGVGGGGLNGSGICGSELAIDNAVFDGCLSENCCDSFVPCVVDAACTACLQDPTGPSCGNDQLFQAFEGCRESTCPSAVCGTDLGYGSPNLNACLDPVCCTSFNTCNANGTCNACLTSMDPEAMGCNNVPQWIAYDNCRNQNCPDDICGAQIVYLITYGNGSQDLNYDAHICTGQSCCSQMHACADPSMDGYIEMTDPEVDDCVACLSQDPSCPGGAVQTAANAFSSCAASNCGL